MEKEEKLNHDGSKAISLLLSLEKNREKLTKAERVKSLLQMQKGLIKRKRTLTDFREPALDLHRRDGSIETYERATTGKMVYTHSNGEERFITLRPEDQSTRDWGDRKIRWYSAHEDYPHAGWNNPVLDNETVTRGYEMTKATDLKYQERIQNLKNKGKLTWLWVIGGIILAIALAITIIPDTFWARFVDEPVQQTIQQPPVIAGALLLFIKNKGQLMKGGIR